jgi:hypothetical protein
MPTLIRILVTLVILIPYRSARQPSSFGELFIVTLIAITIGWIFAALVAPPPPRRGGEPTDERERKS